MSPKNSTLCLLLAILAAAPASAAPIEADLVTGFPFSAGEAANGESTWMQLAGDGRFLALTTWANNLRPGVIDTNQVNDVYVLDRQTGAYDLVSRIAAAPNRTDGGALVRSSLVGISADGRWVAIDSQSEALIQGGSYPAAGGATDHQVFLFDRSTREMQLVSHAPGQPLMAGDHDASGNSLSADGRFVLYGSRSTNLASGGAGNTFRQVYLFDRDAGASILLSHAAGTPGVPGDGHSTAIELSADGRFALIESRATNLIAGLTFTQPIDTYVFDRLSGTLELISRDAGNPAIAVGGRARDLSADGRFVVTDSPGVALQAGLADGNGTGLDTFVVDRQSGIAQLVSHAAAPLTTSGNAGTTGGLVSDDGRFTYFRSEAGNLVAGFTDNNGSDADDVYLHDRQSGAVTLVSHAAGSAAQSANAYAELAFFGKAISPDGRFALLVTPATNLQPGVSDANSETDFYLYDRLAGSSTLASRRGAGLVAGGGYFYASAIALGDGTALFGSLAALDGSRPDHNATTDIYFFDPAAGGAELVTSTPLSGKSAQYDQAYLGAEVMLEKTGRFASWGPYLWDGRTGAIERIAHAAGSPGTPANASVSTGPVSSDGRFVAYSTMASNVLLGGGAPEGDNRSVFFYDRNVDTAFLVTRAHDQPANRCHGDSVVPFMSDDARVFLIESTCDDLLADGIGGGWLPNLWLYDRSAGAFELISHGFTSVLEAGENGATFKQAAADYSWVVYTSGSHRQVPDFVDHNDIPFPDFSGAGIAHGHDLYYRDRATHQARLITRRPGTTNDGSEGLPGLVRASADGSSVFFTSAGDDLVAGQTPQPGVEKIYRWSRAAGSNELVATQPGNPLAPCAGSAQLADVTPDGRYVLFSSTCQLAAGDLNGTQDTYLLDRGRGEVQLISHLPGLPQTSAGVTSTARAISADGRRITFVGDSVAYSYDRRRGEATALSVAHYDPGELAPAEVAIPSHSRRPAVSADGGRVLLHSDDARLVPFDANVRRDHVLVTIGDLFADGFESGDTDAWSQSLP